MDNLLDACAEVAQEVAAGNIDPSTMIVVEKRLNFEAACEGREEYFNEWHELPDPVDLTLVRVWSFPADQMVRMYETALKNAEGAPA